MDRVATVQEICLEMNNFPGDGTWTEKVREFWFKSGKF